MKRLPHARKALIDAAKIRDYLLDPYHGDGGPKAAAFFRYGFERKDWQVLARALIEHVAENLAYFSKVEDGQEVWVVEGALRTPSGAWPLVRSVWAIKDGGLPRLLSAYRIKVKYDPQ